MIIHGDQDEKFDVENTVLLAGAAGDPKEVWIEPGVGHTRLYASDPARYIDRVVGFFDRVLLPEQRRSA